MICSSRTGPGSKNIVHRSQLRPEASVVDTLERSGGVILCIRLNVDGDSLASPPSMECADDYHSRKRTANRSQLGDVTNPTGERMNVTRGKRT
jgi:hypothetical protein